MKAVLEAIEAELGLARDRIAQLEQLRDQAASLNGAGEAPPVRNERQPPAQRAKPGRKSPGRKPSEITRERREAALRLARERTDGIGVSDVMEALHINRDQASRLLRGMAGAGDLQARGTTAARRYFAPEAPLTADTEGNGAKTDVERRILAAIAELSLTAEEVAEEVRLPAHQTRAILENLRMRGVVGKAPGTAGAVYEAHG